MDHEQSEALDNGGSTRTLLQGTFFRLHNQCHQANTRDSLSNNDKAATRYVKTKQALPIK
ncbi:hypothetical protein BDDG_11671 [Blastomyces dermatitidis ATCC 18188]|uniref:Uncharacterized protein n=1 Tax=Ajellomyces dermatitidis (strain ATCC 18188 / CBS 674.68) TaxID=653446 RepID=A0A0J9EJY8_AJEDA|nr:hypothetical protein BDDG_11671 [Blastomyces dermatitidis ATCC 18188]